jgi:DNA-directed RNA polymerase subunit RPC12/RpoP
MRDPARVDVVLVDRFKPGFLPGYSVFATTSCVSCRHRVLLGHETGRAVLREDGPRPLCMECAERIQEEAPEEFNSEKKLGRLEDGACPSCGGHHAPNQDHN